MITHTPLAGGGELGLAPIARKSAPTKAREASGALARDLPVVRRCREFNSFKSGLGV